MDSDVELSRQSNPYQAPAVPDATVKYPQMGIGVWCDGRNIVMHESAELPMVCIKSGEPAACSKGIKAVWTVSRGSFEIAYPVLTVPLAHKWRRVAVEFRNNLGVLFPVIGLPTFGIVCLINTLLNWSWESVEVWGATLSVVIFVLVGGWACIYGETLEHIRSEGQYHWLRGADKRFLKLLPKWNPKDE